MTSSFIVGQKARVSASGEVGTIRHVGVTKFGSGDWIGIELAGPTGKNDGSVQGHRYFTCATNHGKFFRPTALEAIVASRNRVSMAPPVVGGVKKPVSRLSSRQSLATTASATVTSSSVVPSVSGKQAPKQSSVSPATQDAKDALTAQLEHASTVRIKLEDKIKSLSQANTAKDEEVAVLKAALEEAVAGKAAADAKIEEAIANKDEAESNFEAITLEKLGLEDKVEHLQVANAQLTEKLDVSLVEVEIARTDLETSQFHRNASIDDPGYAARIGTENGRLKDILDKARDKIKELQSTITTQQDELDQSTALHSENIELKEQLRKANNTVADQKNIIEANETQETVVIDMQTKIDNLTTELTTAQDSLTHQEGVTQANNEIISQLEASVAFHVEEYEGQSNVLHLAQHMITKLEHKVADLEATQVKFRQELLDRNQEIKEARGSKAESKLEQIEQEKKAQRAQELLRKTLKQHNESLVVQLKQVLWSGQIESIKLSKEIYKTYSGKHFSDVARPVNTTLIICEIKNHTRALADYLRNQTVASGSDFHQQETLLFPRCIHTLQEITMTARLLFRHYQKTSLENFLEFGEAYSEMKSMRESVDSWISNMTEDNPNYNQLNTELQKNLRFLQLIVEKHVPAEVTKGPLGIEVNMDSIKNELNNIKIVHDNTTSMFEETFKLDENSDELDKDQHNDHMLAFGTISTLLVSIHRDHEANQSIVKDYLKSAMVPNEITRNLITDAQLVNKKVFNDYETLQNQYGALFNEEREQSLDYLDIREIAGVNPYNHLIRQFQELATRMKNINLELQNTTNLDEAPEENKEAPWVEHANEVLAEEANQETIKQDLAATKADLAEKNTTIAIKNKAIEELKVNNEVLTKRAADTGANNARTTELERTRLDQADKIELMHQQLQQMKSELSTAQSKNENIAPQVLSQKLSRIPQPTRIGDNGVAKRQLEATREVVRAERQRQNASVVAGFGGEDLVRPKVKESGLYDRTKASLVEVRAELAEKKREEGRKRGKGRNMRMRAREAEGRMNRLRKAMYGARF